MSQPNRKEPIVPEDKIETLFAVARNLVIISDTYRAVETAKQQKAFMAETMASIGLTPDVEVVTVEITTTVGTPELYVEPVEPVEPEPVVVPELPVPGDEETPTPEEPAAEPAARTSKATTAKTVAPTSE